jgi:hypothetical protein
MIERGVLEIQMYSTGNLYRKQGCRVREGFLRVELGPQELKGKGVVEV